MRINHLPPLFASLVALMLVGAACGSDSGGETIVDPSDTPAEEVAGVVLVWTENGGCAQGGPNCARYEVEADGTVNTYRDNGDDPDAAAATGTVDQGLVDAWLAAVESTNVDVLVSRLGPGEMTAAFDGVDHELEAPHASVMLSSVEYEFDESEPFFAAALDLVAAARDAAPLEIEMR